MACTPRTTGLLANRMLPPACWVGSSHAAQQGCLPCRRTKLAAPRVQKSWPKALMPAPRRRRDGSGTTGSTPPGRPATSCVRVMQLPVSEPTPGPHPSHAANASR